MFQNKIAHQILTIPIRPCPVYGPKNMGEGNECGFVCLKVDEPHHIEKDGISSVISGKLSSRKMAYHLWSVVSFYQTVYKNGCSKILKFIRKQER